jgi:hypothetical protein
MFGELTELNETLPAGPYVAGLIDVSVDLEGKAPKNIPFVNAKFEVVGGDYSRSVLWKRFYFSDGTAAKFLPWQMSVLGVKDELDAADCKSHQDTAQTAMILLGKKLGTNYNVNVEVNDNNYNDLVVDSEAEATPELVNHAPTTAPAAVDAEEPIPF